MRRRAQRQCRALSKKGNEKRGSARAGTIVAFACFERFWGRRVFSRMVSSSAGFVCT
jgi:hypothetical protein